VFGDDISTGTLDTERHDWLTTHPFARQPAPPRRSANPID
jgi:hypothetical protein